MRPAAGLQVDTVDLQQANRTFAAGWLHGHRPDEFGVGIEFFQSNAEHELVTRVQKALQDKIAFIVINPAGFTHTSVALRDALAATGIPFIEVHLSNIHAREAFRKHSYFSDLARGVISGLGAIGYELALQAAIQQIKSQGK